ncbi:hypothetical protein SERLA73DRAFT_192212 [Serpula lacrymans var. lacrymans S7.3]|uniref:G domain-containing protein n=2 Tax=Serpula lacrymans var. lacrymans TaxID=341189 RepID=F8QJB4_SERL3|nr:uncharacterized protein SERLADRAFT_471460 [Serpula lacrymans var. lacrymans S7.9]EGN91609.1 hypothetical protein SERLA73DRAFT_192212 [Serpula lacrymans var. lacrymans S7.3]EGO22928.1 hypothetical protein SERLADRAFT_471460 [Serpula lacrymans var. lacrymans S7.9]
MHPPNVILFGETGAGKSSIINLIAGDSIAMISGGASGCTFQYTAFKANIHGRDFMLYDTAGLDEGEEGKVAKQAAIVQLYQLVQALSTQGGVSLLIFCMRGRLKEASQKNWRLFHEVFCRGQVPIVVAITALENEITANEMSDGQISNKLEEWWRNNESAFRGYGMHPQAHACIVSTTGRRNGYADVYNVSQQKMRDVIRDYYRRPSWNVERLEWFTYVVHTIDGQCGKKTRQVTKENGPIIQELREKCGMGDQEALKLAELLNEVK